VYQHKDAGVGRIFFDRLKDTTKVIKILLGTFAFNVKNINEEFDTTKDGLAISFKIAFVKRILSPAIP